MRKLSKAGFGLDNKNRTNSGHLSAEVQPKMRIAKRKKQGSHFDQPALVEDLFLKTCQESWVCDKWEYYRGIVDGLGWKGA